jgi:hypothetical protein
VKPKSRIPRSDATWRLFLLMSQLATEAELSDRKQRKTRRAPKSLRDESPPIPPADCPPGPDGEETQR